MFATRDTYDDSERIAMRFKEAAEQYCGMVDRASTSEKVEILLQIYKILPTFDR